VAGAIFETAVLAELVKALRGRGLDPEVYFWRTSTGTEVGFVVDTGSALVPIEVKASATPRPAMAAGVAAFRNLLGAKTAPLYVVHAGDICLPLTPGVTGPPLADP